jgi:putative ABC transport system substrate-binding protein
LVALGVDLIVTVTTPLALDVRRASASIPVVMITSGFPVEAGVAASLARPGRNVTGNSVYAGGGIFGKYLEFLKSVRPRLKRLGVFWDWIPPNILLEEVQPAIEEFRASASTLDIVLRFYEIRSTTDLDAALSMLGPGAIDALFATSGPVNGQPRNSARLVQFSTDRKIPTMTDFRGRLFRAGFLMTYSPSPSHLSRKAADYVDRILKGANPGDLPIERPSKFDLIINLKTAKALGLTIPESLLQRADQVIE